MSCYIVNEETLNTVVSLWYCAKHGVFKRKPLEEQQPNFADIVQLYKYANNLNIKAVNYRYKDSNEKILDVVTQKQIDNVSFEIINNYYLIKRFSEDGQDIARITQFYKTLQCFLYQCNEGDLYLDNVFSCINEVKNEISNLIVENISEYKKAKWG